ncbi:hypothetical protein CISG_04966 [Coccidioides immitis RMSCC 3703]|uniref:Hemerythrin-like domain-containing protein n=1 Tax=Coccidioides immitis RMSCC 3703 TaxID=454286 RepID=A0A0J8QW58_COCIT|nr:hypothetical protein CISG_04966 [Coccidioides immitis RMSCC 3703]
MSNSTPTPEGVQSSSKLSPADFRITTASRSAWEFVPHARVPEGRGAIDQHRQIHAGLEKLNVYLEECKGRERELRLEELKAVMDGFGDVLWRHLDEEVRELGAEEMSKYWSLEEMRRMPM